MLLDSLLPHRSIDFETLLSLRSNNSRLLFFIVNSFSSSISRIVLNRPWSFKFFFFFFNYLSTRCSIIFPRNKISLARIFFQDFERNLTVKCFVKKSYQIRKRTGLLDKRVESLWRIILFFFQIGTRWLSPIIAHYIHPIWTSRRLLEDYLRISRDTGWKSLCLIQR